jgi:asparagine synthase (glutamine-hydrolysing)
MCGIAGILSYEASVGELEKIKSIPALLRHRGPDFQHSVIKDRVAFAHARLSIIDTSAASNQPFEDETGNYLMVFNGEIFNYKELRAELERTGETFQSNGDVEVLLKLYKKEKENCLHRLRGFFAFAIYDAAEKTLFAARDRFGVKPFYYVENHREFCFSSELRLLLHLTGLKGLDPQSLTTYFELNYLAGKDSIVKTIHRLEPGHWIKIRDTKFQLHPYYKPAIHYKKQAEKATVAAILRRHLEDAVADRMVADVEVGSFLSGGIDSTIVTALAARQTQHLHTFSLGFKDNAFYDESSLAESTAKKLGTDHHTFLVSNDDLLNAFDDFLDAMDEPFADSSALNVFILSRHTKKHVKVVLSGDGADEVFGGYNKHRAEWLMRHNKRYNALARMLAPFTALVPQSRNSFVSNKARQVKKYNESIRLGWKERYWKLASISSEAEVKNLLLHGASNEELKQYYTKDINGDLNTFLLADVNMLLPYDMLTKVDMMSMANGLEVRNPFLDHRLVEFAFSLPSELKLNGKAQKIILKESCKDLIPAEILNRPKHGFEVPIQQWLAGELKSRLEKEWLNEDYIQTQGIFSVEAIRQLKKQLFSNSPGDSAAKVWAILIFNHWYKKHMA